MRYYPKTDALLLLWLINLKTNLPALVEALGLTPAQVTAVQGWIDAGITKIQAVATAETAYKGAIKSRDEMDELPDGDMRLLRAEIARWKTQPGYNGEIGGTLGIIGEADELDMVNYKAELRGSVEGNVIRLRFTKKGADGQNIYRRKKGATDWIFTARDTNSPYDFHPELEVPGKPEHFEFISYAVRKDQEFGQPSDIVQVVYGAVA